MSKKYLAKQEAVPHLSPFRSQTGQIAPGKNFYDRIKPSPCISNCIVHIKAEIMFNNRYIDKKDHTSIFSPSCIK